MLRTWIIRLAILIAVIAVVTIYHENKLTIGALLEATTPPNLPKAKNYEVIHRPGEQNWSDEISYQYHFTTQGSRTLNIPLEWFLALEAPNAGLVSSLFFSQKLFSSPEYLSRFGFVPREVSDMNPHGLPIGFAETPYQTVIGINDARSAIGFTCSACHSGQLVYDNKRHLIDGAGAMIDLGQLTVALGAALAQTALSQQVPVLDGRFDRFASRVLVGRDTAQNRLELVSELKKVLGILAAQEEGIDVIEGFGRLDALNRIGNQVFALDTGRSDNIVNINAPVNFPHIWTSSWFSWVQYDGSIMQPLVRNAGEAMGTAAHTNFTAPREQGRFSNTIPIDNLYWIEAWLAGEDQPHEAKAFNGLRAPIWPEEFPPIDTDLAAQGEALYQEICQGCHLPALTQAIESGQEPDSPFWDEFRPISWWDRGQQYQTSESLLSVRIIPQEHVGTDPAQGNVLARRTVNTAADYDRRALGIETQVCTRAGDYPGKTGTDRLEMINVTDDPLLSFPIALGAAVQLTIDEWLADHALDKDGKEAYEGDRPNCLQAGRGYKARPLNGVWATAPFLHNGSVPTLEHLLGPEENRPDVFAMGNPEFDPVHVGLTLTDPVEETGNYSDEGFFILRTSTPGNSNKGHVFSDDKDIPGRIGRGLQSDERLALIEFLKSI